MKYKVHILPSAMEDLKSIEDGYLNEFDAQTAFKVTDNILHSIERLESFPDSGSLTPVEWLNNRGYRMVICERHISIYKLIEKEVYIYHIFDAKTQYTKLF